MCRTARGSVDNSLRVDAAKQCDPLCVLPGWQRSQILPPAAPGLSIRMLLCSAAQSRPSSLHADFTPLAAVQQQVSQHQPTSRLAVGASPEHVLRSGAARATRSARGRRGSFTTAAGASVTPTPPGYPCMAVLRVAICYLLAKGAGKQRGNVRLLGSALELATHVLPTIVGSANDCGPRASGHTIRHSRLPADITPLPLAAACRSQILCLPGA